MSSRALRMMPFGLNCNQAGFKRSENEHALGCGNSFLFPRTMGPFAPHRALSCWTVDHLPENARLWVDLYGRRSPLASFPGSKLYLLLENELESEGMVARRSLRQALLPHRLPPAIAHV